MSYFIFSQLGSSTHMKYYAEHLRHLNQVSLQIECDVDAVLRAAASVNSVDQLELYSHGSVDVVHLPVHVEPVEQKIRAGPQKVRLTPLTSWSEPLQKFVPPKELIAPGRFVQWKALPSEHWAELMDVWHCHKPHAEGNSHCAQPHAASSGDSAMYELAMNGFHAQPGLAYYSDTYYLIDPSDLKDGSAGPKIWRWDAGEPVNIVLRHMLRELVDAHAIYTFVVNDRLGIWVLNTEAVVSFTGGKPACAVKALITGADSPEMKQRPDPEPVVIPEPAFEELVRILRDTNGRLPTQAQKMDNWELTVI